MTGIYVKEENTNIPVADALVEFFSFSSKRKKIEINYSHLIVKGGKY